MEQTPKKIYFNAPQRLTQLIGANTTVIVAGRRTGKTDSIASPFVLRNMQRMPGSTGGIVVPTYKHGLTNTIPGLLAAWKRWGFMNGIHYVIGRRPPKSFGKPIIEPAEYEHVITSSADVCGLFGGAGSKAVIQRVSVTNGSITSTGTGVGGVIGAVAGEAKVYQCSFSGSISVTNSGSYCGAGGIAAAAAGESEIIECSFHGSITATNNGGFTSAAGAGGIVGIAMDSAYIGFCYNAGNITGSAFLLSVAAGIVGATLQENSVSVFSCYNVGTVNAGTKGGIFGMVSPINPKDENAIDVNNCFYLNTCGGTTSYGTSKTSAEMQTNEFMFTIDQLSHCFAMDNGTNNGYPVSGLTGIKVYEPSDITAHSAHLSAEVHPGNHSFTEVLFYCEDGVYDEHTVHVGNEGYVEATMEPLLDNTRYLYLLGVTFEDNNYEEFGTGYFFTEFDGISEISNHEVQIYPNPTSDFIFIENIEPQLVTIYSLDGKLVKSVENADIVDVRDLESGLYLINIDGAARKIQIK